jgi:hypothetical protein
MQFLVHSDQKCNTSVIPQFDVKSLFFVRKVKSTGKIPEKTVGK